MIPDRKTSTGVEGIGLDELLLASVKVRPDALCLRQPARREAWAGSPGKAFSHRELDLGARRLAGLLLLSRLPARSQAVIMAPLGAEQTIAILGALRADLSPLLLSVATTPMELQRMFDAAGACIAIGVGRCGDIEPALLMRDAAARSFNVRLVCGFGPKPPDGVAPLDAILEVDAAALPEAPARAPSEERAIAIETADGERQLLLQSDFTAAAVEIAGQARLPAEGRLVSLMMGPSLSALAAGPYLALLGGCEFLPLGLFSLSALWAGLADGKPSGVVAPAALEASLRASGIVGHANVVSLILLHKHRPDHAMATEPGGTRIVDVWPEDAGRLAAAARG